MPQNLNDVLAVGNDTGGQDITGNGSAISVVVDGLAVSSGNPLGGSIQVTSVASGFGWLFDIINGSTLLSLAEVSTGQPLFTYNITNQELIIPSGTALRLPSFSAVMTPARGDVAYDYTLHKLKQYNGSAWETVTSV